ncbi:serine/threonine-protein kinase BLUS1-like isoform X2 [Andrographis paniculata]|uniref:serine/threonine-protein kinase BLUS1-like isoform X2 n=1 Tax=Andrographis paniculata TaxID=175694 RepID=UPI0021E993E6|nr:serine/threonine-protein kinase BLUS1-like isoform X2 [Andrographis paniculata]
MGRNYSVNPKDYELHEEVGHGASATVYRAIHLPSKEEVAVKCLDLDRCNSNLDDIRREAQTMNLIDHPNVIKAFCSFVVDRDLWVVMPYMDEGSCLHLMKAAYPDGLEEPAIGSILKETLKALEYLHQQGHIHRDVKAGNILMDSSGEVKLADFGVSTCMFDRGDRRRSRNTFVGTPCWMAPEVLQPGTGYDFKADIWSFGITALELAHGHAPFSKYPPMKVLLMTLQSAPPGLDYERDKKFSKSFKEVVAMCLVKDQTKRPTAEKLLKHSFFRNAKLPQLCVKKLFTNLPPLWKRVKDLQLKDAEQLALKKMPSAEQEALSQSEYQRGVSAWNFDVEDLKFQASLLQEEDEIQEVKDDDSDKSFKSNKVASSFGVKPGAPINNPISPAQKEKISESDLIEPDNQGNTGISRNTSKAQLSPPVAEKDGAQTKGRVLTGKPSRTQSGPLTPGTVLSHSQSERARNFERYEIENQQLAERPLGVRRVPSFSGPLNLPTRASANSLSAPIKSSGDSLEDKSKPNLVQIKGRFSVTSENVDLVKDFPVSTSSRRISSGFPLMKSASTGNWLLDSKQMPNGQPPKENMPTSVLMPQLQNLFHQTSIQQDIIMNILNSLQVGDAENASQNGKLPPLPLGSENNGSAELIFSERERMLLMKISELQERTVALQDEITLEKVKYMELQQQLNTASGGRFDGETGDS